MEQTVLINGRKKPSDEELNGNLYHCILVFENTHWEKAASN